LGYTAKPFSPWKENGKNKIRKSNHAIKTKEPGAPWRGEKIKGGRETVKEYEKKRDTNNIEDHKRRQEKKALLRGRRVNSSFAKPLLFLAPQKENYEKPRTATGGRQ